jgi:ribosomal protein S18 acetylase RimI-like enzyme
MEKSNNTPLQKLENINMRLLRHEDIDDYLAIEFDAFFEKLRHLYGNRRRAAYRIIKAEMEENLDLGRYLNAVYDDRAVGIMELVTKENSGSYRKKFSNYTRNLGFLGAMRTYFLTFLDMPAIDKSTIYINNVAVSSDFRRRGVATAMLSYAEYIARSRGKDRLKLWVANDNKVAYMFYRKMGFYQLMFRSSKMAERYMGYREWVFMCKDIV